MKIGILGSGVVGQALAKGFKAEGNEVVIATRNPSSAKAKKLNQDLQVQVQDFESTAKFSEVAVLCTIWTGTENAIKLAGAENLSYKIVIDTTNPLDTSGSELGLILGLTDSAGEQVQRWLADSYVVKAFNSIGNSLMYKPEFADGPPAMFYCGNDTSAKHKMSGILKSFGWEAIDIGDIKGARLLEPLGLLWINYGFMTNTWHHALKMLT